ncbi:MAG: hypothetical protein WAQ28_15470 [Bacteroidia bacterium]
MNNLKKAGFVLIFLGIVAFCYSQNNQDTITFDTGKPFLLETKKVFSNGDLMINFGGSVDVMGTNLNPNAPTPTSYYSYIIELSDKTAQTTIYIKSYEIGKPEATKDWNGYQFTVLDNNVERLKLHSSLEGRVLKVQVSQKAK